MQRESPFRALWFRVSSDTRPELQLKTDASGQFNFKVSPGRYMLKASFSGFEVTRARLDVGADILNLFHPTALRVILSVGSMDCPWSQPATRNSKNSFTNMPCGNELALKGHDFSRSAKESKKLRL